MNNFTEIVFILDKSGSMEGLEKDTIGGYNSFLKKQKEQGNNAVVSTVLFSDETVVLHDRVPIDKVEPLTDKDYVVGGCTALLDAIGFAVCHIESVHSGLKEEKVPDSTVFVITTDGMENASQEFSYKKVKKLITGMREEKNWEFLFVAQDLNVMETAEHMGIARNKAAFYDAAEDTKELYCCMCDEITNLRQGKSLSCDWADGIRKKKTKKDDTTNDKK